jgi:hypothetical protein
MIGVKIEMDAIFYIDESGNTGTDWLNNQQPYFVYGGWLLKSHYKNDMEKYLKYIISNQQGSELKSKNLIKRKDGIKIFSEIFNKALEKFNAIPFFSITEKKFMVAAKIVETFFDSEYNPYVNQYLTNPVELKRALASCIVTNDTIVNIFASLIKNCTSSPELMKQINDELINHFNKEGLGIVAETLIHLSEENFMEMINEFETVTHNGTRKNRITLTGTMLLELFKNIQFLCFGRDLYVDVYHDELRGYDDFFKELENTFLKSKKPVLLGTLEKPWLSNYPNIKSLNMVNSKIDEINAQASDLLCGFISNTFKLIENGVALDGDSKEIIKTLVVLHDVFLQDDVLVWNWYASYQFEEKFFSALNPDAKINRDHYRTVIENEFCKALK